jgi:hypothetical protein
MLFVKLTLYACVLSFITGCASHTAPFATNHEDTWFLEQSAGNTYPIYCRANKKDAVAEPICYRAKKTY